MKYLLASLLLLCSHPSLAANAFSLGTGIDYSTGKYGEAVSTDILYVPVTAKYEMDQFTFKLVVPYISITGPGGVIPGLGALPSSVHGYGKPANPGRPITPGPPGPPGPPITPPGRGGSNSTYTATHAGLGDVVASGDYEFYSRNALMLDLVGKIKFGTANPDEGLGTGQNDYSMQLDSTYQFINKSFLFATVGYKLVGKPAGVIVHNIVYGTVGLSTKVTTSASAGVMLNYAPSALDTGKNVADLTVFVSNKLSRDTKLQMTVLKGLADGSPDFGVGMSVTQYF